MTSKTQGKDEVSGMEAAFEKWFEARHCVVVVGQSSLRLTCKEAFRAGFNAANARVEELESKVDYLLELAAGESL